MVDLNKNTGSCSHCNSSDVRYYGFTVNTMHYYYECISCHKFTEYHITSKKLILLELIPVIMFAAIVATLSVVETIPFLALLLFFGSILLFVISYNYRWSFGEIIALDKLPDNRLIIRAVPHKIRLIAIVIFSAALISYIGLFIFNTVRQ